MSLLTRGKLKKIYIRFRWQGIQYCESSTYNCEKKADKNCKCRGCLAASTLDLEISRKIKLESFVFSEYFPKSRALKTMGIISTQPDITFADYSKQWLALKEPVTSWSTYKDYVSIVNILSNAINMKLRDIKTSHIRHLVTTLAQDLSAKTIKNRMSVLQGILDYAVDDKIIEESPYKKIKIPKMVKKLPDPFTYNEVVSILQKIEEIEPRLTCFYAIGFFAGLRTGEILALEWGDIDLKSSQISVSKTISNGKSKQGTKTGKSIVVDIQEVLAPYIKNHQQFSRFIGEALFLTKSNEQIRSYQTITRTWQKALQLLGIRYRQPYQMRHTFACLMLAVGEDPNWIKSQLGHSNLRMLFAVYGNWYKPLEKAGNKFTEFVQKSSESDQLVIKHCS